MTAPLPPIPNRKSVDSNGNLVPVWESWFAQLRVFITESSSGGGGLVPFTRKINTLTPLSGGGDLGSDLTLSLLDSGVVPATYGNSTSAPQITIDSKGRVTAASNILITPTTTLTGDVSGIGAGSITTTLANTAVPPGAYGDGTHVAAFTVDSKGRITAASSVAITGAAPTGAAGGDLSGTYPNPTVSKINGVALGSTTATSTNILIANGSSWVSKTISGDITITNTGVVTLANSGVTAASYGSATQSPVFAVDAKGRITSVTNTTITPAIGSITGLGTGVSTALAVNVGSAGAFVTFNGALGTPASGVATNLTGTASSLTAGTATNTTITDDTSTNATMYLTWVTANTGNLPQKVSSTKLSFNPSTAVLTTTTFSGALSGNATTSTTLQNARTIGGVSFDGSANITVATATGGFTVSGGALALGSQNITMTGSIASNGSRVTKGWFTDLDVTNTITGSVSGNAATVTTNANLTGPITSSGNATSIASQTGTGTKFVVDTSPTIATPTLSGNVTQSSGNYSFTSTGQRILGDFTNATVTNRLTFQTNSGTNSNTFVAAIPLGTATVAAYDLYNNSDPTNAGQLRLQMGSNASINSTASGSGTAKPLVLQASGTTGLKIDTSANTITLFAFADQSYSRQVPTTGFSITISNNTRTLILDPAGALLAGTVTMPSTPIDGQIINICSSQTITTLTVSANTGQTMADAFATTLSGGAGLMYIYNLANTKWFRLS